MAVPPLVPDQLAFLHGKHQCLRDVQRQAVPRHLPEARSLATQKRGFKTKRDAELFLANMEVDKSRGAYVDPSKSRVLLGEWLDSWMAGRSDWKPTSRERARGIVEIHIKPKLGQYPFGALDHQTIQK